MREFKFRVFLIDTGKYISSGVDIAEISLVRKWEKYYIIEQYTGRKDKHGTEIYEGDKLLEPVSPVGGENGGYLYQSRVIKWEGVESGYKLFAPEAASEIIGNIHEDEI